MSADFTIAKDQTRPKLTATLTDDLGVVDLTSWTVVWRMWNWDDDELAAEKEATVVGDPALGSVELDWDPEHTATRGRYYGRWEKQKPGSESEPYPSDDYLEVRVF